MSSSTDGRQRQRTRSDEWVALAGALLMVAALWLHWYHSGERAWNAFDLLIAADRLDVGPGVLGDVWIWLLPLAPAFGALAWTAMFLRKRLLFVASIAAVVVIVGVPAVLSLIVEGPGAAGELVAVAGLIAVAVGFSLSRLLEAKRPA